MLSLKDNPYSFILGLIPSLFTALILDARIRISARRLFPAASLWLHSILLLLSGHSPIVPSGPRPVKHFDARLLFGRRLIPAPVLLYPQPDRENVA